MATKSGTSANDKLIGGSGNDKLYGKGGNDLLAGGDGNDVLSGDKGDDRLEGGAGNDQLAGGEGADRLIGGAGHDLLRGGAGNDLLEGGNGNDLLEGGKGNDHLLGGAGHDLLHGGDGNDRLEGGKGDDYLLGGKGNDRLEGGDGNDHLSGGTGDDHLIGGAGRDVLNGDAGNDRLEGGAGHDELYGRQDNDVLVGGAGNDYLSGGKGDDLFIYRTGDGNDEVNGDGGTDTIRLHADGWALKLTKGKVVSSTDGQMKLSDSAAGTITLADGSTIRFKNIERIETVASKPDPAPQPMGLTLEAGPVDENAPDGSIVGTAVTTGSAAAARAPAGLTYSLTEDAGGRFAIDPHTGVITVADGAALDHESAAQHSITVEVTDAGGPGVTRTFAIEVADVNEAPGITGLDSSAIAEGAAEGTVVGTVSASDPDAGDVLTFALSDDAGGRFAIDPHTGVITVADGAALDHESAAQHGVTVEVTDAGGLSASKTFTIAVADVDEAPGGLSLDASAVAENASEGTVVGAVSAVYPGTGDTLSYALTDDAGGRFAIDPHTGVITVADGASFDYESVSQHGITVQVTGAGGLSASETFTIAVADVNEAPGITGLDASQIAADAAAGTVVGTVSAADPDAGDALAYSLTDDAGGRFAIDPDSGVITVADGAAFDHDVASQHSVTVQVTDAGGLSTTRTFAIEVAEANQAPAGLGLGASAVAEGALGGTVVGTVTASDPNGDALTYSLTDDAGGRFAIDPDTGVITVADGAALDHESAAQHGIEVTVTDAGGLSASKTFTIEVADVNEAPGGLSLDASEVGENAAAGTVVGAVSAADPDAGDALSYALTDDAGGRFTIHPHTGVITVADGAALDHESAPQHNITVEVTDAGGLSTSQTFTIAVANVNEAPGGLALSASAVTEHAAEGTVVGTVSAADPDAGDTLSYTLTDDAGGRFAIDAQTGVITVGEGALLDYESAAQHSVTVRVTDAGGLSASHTFTIEVADVNEAPGGLSLDANEVAENAAVGTVVGTASADDPDTGDALTYSLTDDAGGRFAIDPHTGVITVANGALLDHESAAQHSVTIEVTDAGGLSATQTFAIAVTDVNEAPGGLTLDASEVGENATAGTVVGTASASDPDAGDALSYALTDDAGGRFAIDPDTGVITVADGAAFDHDVASQHGVTVQVTDAGGLSTTRSFVIDVIAVNGAPSIAGLSASEVDENAVSGTVVGVVNASDPDAGDALSYALTDDAGGRFAIDPATGVITVASGALLDHESAAEHEIVVEVTDSEGLSTTRTFTIAVADVNEAPAIIGLVSTEVVEHAAEGTVVGTVGAGDPDAGDALTYVLSDDADGRFAIDPNTGVITVADSVALNYEHATQHSIEVTVSDGGGLSATRSFTIQVADVNEAPVIQTLSSNQVIEGAPDGTVVGTVSSIDPDLGETLTYALTDDAGGRFAIDPDTGVVTVVDGSLLDYDAAAQHGITVEVTDAQGLSNSVTYVIDLQKDNSGNDTLTGGAGDDLLDGGPGDDFLVGGGGHDHLIGGSGDDDLQGGAGNDLLEGGDGNDFLFGDAGNDQLFGGDGNDFLFGGLGDDRVDGGAGDDELSGSVGNDVLIGGDGNDQLFGGVGNDVLVGGAGDDILSGEDGADRFVFASPDEGVDRIMDFRASDVLAIGDMLVGFAAGNEAAFVRLLNDGADTIVQVDVDGAANGESYQSIAVLNNVSGVSLTDLVGAGQIDFWMS